MGLLTGSVGYIRFAAIGEVPDALGDVYAEALAGHAFREIDAFGEEERSQGWVRFDDPFSSEWAPHEIGEEGGRVVFRMRVDTLKVPAVMLKAYTVAGERERLRAAGREKLTRPEKDQVKSDVRKELRRRSLAKMALYDIVWNLGSGEVRLFATSRSVAGLFVEAFEKTFALKLQQLSPAVVLWMRGMVDEELDQLAGLEPERFHLQAGRSKPKGGADV